MNKHPPETLLPEISAYSSYSNSFFPQNCLDDTPSRWSSKSISGTQFLLFRFKEPVFLTGIEITNPTKAHVCAVTCCSVIMGPSVSRMVRVIDNLPLSSTEKTIIPLFPWDYNNVDGHLVSFVALVPKMSSGLVYNYSFWNIQFIGYSFNKIPPSIKLKELEGPFADPCSFIKNNTISLFHKLDFCNLTRSELPPQAQKFYDNFTEENFSQILQKLKIKKNFISPKIIPQRITVEDSPSPRGGAAMVSDSFNDCIWLFGGFDGEKDLSDFYKFDLKAEKWQKVVINSPSARSCHKMIFVPESKFSGPSIYLFGQYSALPKAAELWRFDCREMSWELLQNDAYAHGGPPSRYDCCGDVVGDFLVIFGGVCISDIENNTIYKMSLETLQWSQLKLRSAFPLPPRSSASSAPISDKHILIFGGRCFLKSCDDSASFLLDDAHIINIYSGIVTSLAYPLSNPHIGAPEAGCAQRIVFDEKHRKIFCFVGMKSWAPKIDFERRGCGVFEFDLECLSWRQLFSFDENHMATPITTPSFSSLPATPLEFNNNPQNNSIFLDDNGKFLDIFNHKIYIFLFYIFNKNPPQNSIDLIPRYAHCVAYDQQRSNLWVFGGNGGVEEGKRLDEFLKIRVQKIVQKSEIKKWLEFFGKIYFILFENSDKNMKIEQLQKLERPSITAEEFISLLSSKLLRIDKNERADNYHIFDDILYFFNNESLAKSFLICLINLFNAEKGYEIFE